MIHQQIKWRIKLLSVPLNIADPKGLPQRPKAYVSSRSTVNDSYLINSVLGIDLPAILIVTCSFVTNSPTSPYRRRRRLPLPSAYCRCCQRTEVSCGQRPPTRRQRRNFPSLVLSMTDWLCRCYPVALSYAAVAPQAQRPTASIQGNNDDDWRDQRQKLKVERQHSNWCCAVPKEQRIN